MELLDVEQYQTYSCIAETYDCVSEAEGILKKNDEETSSETFSEFQRLIEIKYKYSVPGWDGNDALPVSTCSFKNALLFMLNVPEGFDLPFPGVCANGQITLEWRNFDGRLLSLAFDDKGNVSYIAFLPDGEMLSGIRVATLGYQEPLINFLKKVS